MAFGILGLLLGGVLIILGGTRVGGVGRKSLYVSLILIGGLFVILSVLQISNVPIWK
jgi:hypothetical protein